MQKEKVVKEQYIVDSFNADFKRNLTLAILGKDLLNIADKHSYRQGLGVERLAEINRAWVLSRLCIEMKRMPRQGEHYAISTWVENLYRLFTNRNFSIVALDDGNQEVATIGYARSVWAMIDKSTRLPIDLSKVYGELFDGYFFPENDCPIEGHSRIRKMNVEGKQPLFSHRVIYSDLDCNSHVNSMKYVEHICNLFPMELYDIHQMHRLEIAYVAEAYFDETLLFYVEETSPLTYQVEVVKDGSGSESGIVTVARALVVWK